MQYLKSTLDQQEHKETTMKRTIRPLSALTGASGAEHVLGQSGIDLKATASQIDKIQLEIFNRSELTNDQKHIKVHQNINDGMIKFHKQLGSAKEFENAMLIGHESKLKTSQLKDKVWNDKLSSMLPFVMADLKNKENSLDGKSDNYLQIVLSLGEDNLVTNKTTEINTIYSRDTLGYIEKSKDNLNFINKMESKAEEFLSYDLQIGELPGMLARQNIPTFQD